MTIIIDAVMNMVMALPIIAAVIWDMSTAIIAPTVVAGITIIDIINIMAIMTVTNTMIGIMIDDIIVTIGIN